ncbi:hypothetical protein E2C01_095803 [Portunus trituberculatus]|uniref:Uncharacterized protein n=1 Tax=Portunus trituberculatus TaxID=210409 RepID=A0A5B7K1C7_PORTR|nr:hypothetical protein [Portunus trituberculatus]
MQFLFPLPSPSLPHSARATSSLTLPPLPHHLAPHGQHRLSQGTC